MVINLKPYLYKMYKDLEDSKQNNLNKSQGTRNERVVDSPTGSARSVANLNDSPKSIDSRKSLGSHGSKLSFSTTKLMEGATRYLLPRRLSDRSSPTLSIESEDSVVSGDDVKPKGKTSPLLNMIWSRGSNSNSQDDNSSSTKNACMFPSPYSSPIQTQRKTMNTTRPGTTSMNGRYSQQTSEGSSTTLNPSPITTHGMLQRKSMHGNRPSTQGGRIGIR